MKQEFRSRSQILTASSDGIILLQKKQQRSKVFSVSQQVLHRGSRHILQGRPTFLKIALEAHWWRGDPLRPLYAWAIPEIKKTWEIYDGGGVSYGVGL